MTEIEAGTTQEWLLSGHNTLESMAIARPYIVTGAVARMNVSVDRFMEHMLKGIMPLDKSLSVAIFVQGLIYLNVNYFVRNSGFPFDPASLGVPTEFVRQYPEYVVKESRVSLARTPTVLHRYQALHRWLKHFYEQRLPACAEELRELYWELRRSPDEEALAWKVFSPQYEPTLEDSGYAHVVSFLSLMIVDNILRQRAPQLLNLFAGRTTITSQMSQRVWELHQIAESCGEKVSRRLQNGVTDPEIYAAIPEAAPFVEAVNAFLQDYGHRGFRYELDMTADRIADHPRQILLAVAGQKGSVVPEERAQAARQAGEDVLNQIAWPKRTLWSRVLKWAQRLIGWRESTKSFLTLHQSICGIALSSLSRRFYPNDPENMLLFYTFDEFERFKETQGREKVSRRLLDRRKAEFELHASQSPPPETIWYNPQTRLWHPAVKEGGEKAEPSSENRMEGIGASPGTGPVEGIALVTNDPYEAGQALLKAEGPIVLVTRLTDPAWSSIFARLTAVVTERGGVISHAAIIARENGLPAVASVPNVTQRIRSGQRVRVDGYSGVVEILDVTSPASPE